MLVMQVCIPESPFLPSTRGLIDSLRSVCLFKFHPGPGITYTLQCSTFLVVLIRVLTPKTITNPKRNYIGGSRYLASKSHGHLRKLRSANPLSPSPLRFGSWGFGPRQGGGLQREGLDYLCSRVGVWLRIKCLRVVIDTYITLLISNYQTFRFKPSCHVSKAIQCNAVIADRA